MSGIRNSTCRVKERKTPRGALPIAVKKFDERICTPLTITMNRKVRIKRTANSKYSGEPVPNSEISWCGKNWNSTKPTAEMRRLHVMASRYVAQTRSICLAP